MSMWKKAMDYLGLGPDDAYDDYDIAPEPERPVRAARPPRDESARVPRNFGQDYEPEPPRPAPQRPSFPSREPDVVIRRPAPAGDDSSVQPRPINPRPVTPVRPAPAAPTADPHTVRPRRFDSAQEVADKFKEGQPVIMNLEAADREVSRRLIDFASGLCYGLNGTMEKVATGVYLLKPNARNGYDGADYGG
ncbi:MAG: cell division protein SepF [Acidimicrobiaceae bacterium]|nr:cell division protein SepF [Ilumatobacter sp.]MCB9381178.1 cell division protein SepF [Acidimicrobiaceae bacterium]